MCRSNGEVMKCRSCHSGYDLIRSGDVLACCLRPDGPLTISPHIFSTRIVSVFFHSFVVSSLTSRIKPNFSCFCPHPHHGCANRIQKTVAGVTLVVIVIGTLANEALSM